MLYVNENGSIRLTRGDTARLSVDITNDLTGDPYIINDKDELTLTIKQKLKDEEPLLQKKITGSNTFEIEPADTANLAFATYKYDVQLTTAGGDVFTVIEPTSFEIMAEVTC